MLMKIIKSNPKISNLTVHDLDATDNAIVSLTNKFLLFIAQNCPSIKTLELKKPGEPSFFKIESMTQIILNCLYLERIMLKEFEYDSWETKVDFNTSKYSADINNKYWGLPFLVKRVENK